MPQLRKQRTFLRGKMYPSVFVRCFFVFGRFFFYLL